MDLKEKIYLFRQRYYGRQDVYGKGWSAIREGKQVRGFTPACANYYSSGCHIKLKDGTPCSSCEIKEYEKFSDEVIEKHIKGQASVLIYLLHEDGTVLFAAIDFDMKPGKESVGHTYEDVMKASKILSSVGIPHGIARSTNMGHHLYIFFSTPVDSRKIRSIFKWVFEKAGFTAEAKEGLRPLPEMFPKQAGTEGGLGNGIKPPMIETNFENGRNCFIISDKEVPEDQWEYLKSIPTISLSEIDAVITRENIDVSSEYTNTKHSENTPWQPPSSGSIHKVLEGCAAFKRLAQQLSSGHTPSHDEGFALWHMCINVADGEEWFLNNAPNWGKSEADLKQLQQSKDRNYKPWSCKTMQDKGVCVKGTKCFEKKPPLIIDNGQVKEDLSIPETEWPSPSPYRYAIGRGELYMAQLLKSVDLLLTGEDVDHKRGEAKKIIDNSMIFDEDQQNILKEKLAETDIFKKSQLNRMFSQARKERETKVGEILQKRSDTISFGNGIFKRNVNPWGYAKFDGISGDTDIIRTITNFVLDIEEERVLVEDNDTLMSRSYLGKFRADDFEKSFEIDAASWENNAAFVTYFSNLCGSKWVVSKKDIDDLKLIAMAAAGKEMYMKPKIKPSQLGSAPGWYGETYVMPSVLVDKDGARPNDLIPLSTSNKEHARYLDFSLLGNSELKDVLRHIWTDLIGAFPEVTVFNALGFTMMVPLMRYLNLPYRPTLWFEGESGAGKTALCVFMQKFFGDFKGPLNWTTTAVSMNNYGYDFKDCLLLVDDYKEYGNGSRAQICQQIVQNAYQYSARGVSQKDGSQRELRFSRCCYMMTGEETPVNETSFIARLLLIYYPLQDTTKTIQMYERCQAKSKDYKGVMPQFIHWALNKNKEELLDEFKQLQLIIRGRMSGVSNADRLAYNAGLAHFGWQMFLLYLKEMEIIDRDQMTDYIDRNWEHIMKILHNLSDRCFEEKNSVVFIHRLKELIHSGEVSIKGLSNFDSGNNTIGFVESDSEEFAYLYPSRTLDEIKKRSQDTLTLNQAAIAAQLRTLEVLIPGSRSNTIFRKVNGSNIRVWKVSLVKLGLVSTNPLKVVHTSPGPTSQTTLDSNGVL